MKIFLILVFLIPITLFAEERIKGTVKWDNHLTLNLGIMDGNTASKQLGGDFQINRNELWVNECTITGNGAYQDDNGNIIVQNSELALRFGWSITRPLYNFYRLAFKHNRVLHISSQYIPSSGFGYWFFDVNSFKLLIEAGIGYNSIYYFDCTKKSEIIFQPRFFLELHFFDHYAFGNNTYYYYGMLKQILDSRTYFKIIANDKIAAKFEFIVNYNNKPGYDLKQLDYQLKSGIELKT